VLAFPRGGWPRVALAALLVVPLVLLLLLMTPCWLTWPFLADKRRSDVRAIISTFVDWIKAVAGNPPPDIPDGQPSDFR
jgi:hypothetical protein